VDRLIQEAVSQHTSSECMETLVSAQVPCGLDFSYNELRVDPQVKLLRMFEWNDTPWGEVRVGGLPWRFSKTPGEIRATRKPGQDTQEIMALAESIARGELQTRR